MWVPLSRSYLFQLVLACSANAFPFTCINLFPNRVADLHMLNILIPFKRIL